MYHDTYKMKLRKRDRAFYQLLVPELPDPCAMVTTKVADVVSTLSTFRTKTMNEKESPDEKLSRYSKQTVGSQNESDFFPE